MRAAMLVSRSFWSAVLLLVALLVGLYLFTKTPTHKFGRDSPSSRHLGAGFDGGSLSLSVRSRDPRREFDQVKTRIEKQLKDRELLRMERQADGVRRMPSFPFKTMYQIPDGVGTIEFVEESRVFRRPTSEELLELEEVIRLELASVVGIDAAEREEAEIELRKKFLNYDRAFKIVSGSSYTDHQGIRHTQINAFNDDQVIERPYDQGAGFSPGDDVAVPEPGGRLRGHWIDRYGYIFGFK